MIQVNDEPLDFEPGITVADVLKKRGFVSRMLAVWVDGDLVPRDRYETTAIPDGASVTIVHMIAGG